MGIGGAVARGEDGAMAGAVPPASFIRPGLGKRSQQGVCGLVEEFHAMSQQPAF